MEYKLLNSVSKEVLRMEELVPFYWTRWCMCSVKMNPMVTPQYSASTERSGLVNLLANTQFIHSVKLIPMFTQRWSSHDF